MKNKQIFQFAILGIIFLSMIAIIFIGMQLLGDDSNQSYQPNTKAIKIKAATKTYTRLLALNYISPTLVPSLTTTPVISEEISPSLANEDQLQSPTPTEVILAQTEISPTLASSVHEEGSSSSEVLPESGTYQSLLFLVGLSFLIITFAFIL
jgi:hypothetical protein